MNLKEKNRNKKKKTGIKRGKKYDYNGLCTVCIE